MKGASALITSLNIAYDEEETRGFLELNLVTLAIAIGFALIAILAILAIGVVGILEASFLLRLAFSSCWAKGSFIWFLLWRALPQQPTDTDRIANEQNRFCPAHAGFAGGLRHARSQRANSVFKHGINATSTGSAVSLTTARTRLADHSCFASLRITSDNIPDFDPKQAF